MIAQKERTRRQPRPRQETRDLSAPAPAPSPALADELGRLEHAERAARDRLRQQELERLREVARCD